jgi:hypothetical protein
MMQIYETRGGAWEVRVEVGATMTSATASFDFDAWTEAYERCPSLLGRE